MQQIWATNTSGSRMGPLNAPPSDSPDVKKIKKAASEFEAMLLAKWWSSMKESGLGDADNSDPGHDTLDEMGIQAMSTAVASAGGLGIGAMLVHSLLSNTRDSALATPPAVSLKTGNNGT
jgi:Rod binding domain-containing protein